MQLLDFDGCRLQGARPFFVWEWHEGAAGDPLADLRAAWQNARAHFPDGGMLGYFSYDFARALEPRGFAHDAPSPPPDLPVPLARWTFYEELVSAPLPPAPAPCSTEPVTISVAETDAEYEARVRRILALISAGDLYQANLTRRFTAPLRHTPQRLYERLRATPMPMSALLEYDDFALVSHSPERFWSLQGGTATAQPIKGTRPRGNSMASDAAARHELESSAKDRAENVMIVDLLRNDLGRVCRYGSVEVDQLFQPIAFPTVWHGVSTIRGTLRPDCDVFDLLSATFPCGSITGAPKIRAMQVIDSLEPIRRAAAMGAIGYIDFRGNADFNVAIRTATCLGNAVYFHAGGGIVAQSEPHSERQEIEAKTRALLQAL